MFHKIMGNLEKNAGIGDIISYFFLYYFNCRAKKGKNPTGGKYMIFFPPVSLFFPIRPCNNCSTFRDGKREIKSYNV